MGDVWQAASKKELATAKAELQAEKTMYREAAARLKSEGDSAASRRKKERELRGKFLAAKDRIQRIQAQSYAQVRLERMMRGDRSPALTLSTGRGAIVS